MHKVGTTIYTSLPLVTGEEVTTLLLYTSRTSPCFQQQGVGSRRNHKWKFNHNLSLPWGSGPRVGLLVNLNIRQVQHGDLAFP